MKLTNLFENSNQYNNMEKECGQILESYKNGSISTILYRGTDNTNDSIKIDIKKNRAPRNTIQFFHDVSDAFFYKKFGYKARSQSLFCSSSKKQASLYGNVNGVLPVGKQYKFIYSSHVVDLYYILKDKFEKHYSFISDKNREKFEEFTNKIKLNNFMDLSLLDVYYFTETEEDKNILANIFLDILESKNYIMDNNLSNIKDKIEVMVVCEDAYLIPTNSHDVIRLEYDYNIYI